MEESDGKVVGNDTLNSKNFRNQINRNDICDAYVEDTERLFGSRECWYCKHGDFGINTGNPSKLGVCLNKTEEI